MGGGALYFYLKNKYRINESYLSDNNPDLILTYKVIKYGVKELIEKLKDLEDQHLNKTELKRKENYNRLRELYNRQEIDFKEINKYNELSKQWINRACYFIFLNKTCYNGLYRLNKEGKFNVPFGRYKKPLICDEKNLKKAAYSLEDTALVHGDYKQSEKFIDKGTFLYLDPPYRPLNSTSNFTAYSSGGFNDSSQQELAQFFIKIDGKGACIMLSNSDPKNSRKNDNFFDDLYRGYKIERVSAKRNINSAANKRGDIKELIIRNYS